MVSNIACMACRQNIRMVSNIACMACRLLSHPYLDRVGLLARRLFSHPYLDRGLCSGYGDAAQGVEGHVCGG